MDKSQVRILIINDYSDDRRIINPTILSEIQLWRCRPEWTAGFETALAAMVNNEYEIYLINFRAEKTNELDLIRTAIAQGCQSPIILLIDQLEAKIGIEALRIGATDYLFKNRLNPALLEHSIQRGLDCRRVGPEGEDVLADEQVQLHLAEALHNIGLALSRTLDLDEILGFILANVERVITHDAADIMLIESGSARVVSARGYENHGQTGIQGMRLRLVDFPLLQLLIDSTEPLVISDTHISPHWTKVPETSWIRSYVGIPIWVKDQVVGVFNLNSAQTNTYDRIKIKVFQAFAYQASIAIGNARLLEAEQAQRLLSETLGRVGLALNSTLALPELLNLICQESISLFNVGAAFVWLIQGAELVGFAGHGLGQEKFIGLRLPLSDAKTLGPRIVREKRAIFVNDAQNASSVNSELVNLFQIKAILGVPMIKGDNVVGALMFVDSRQAQRFSSKDGETALVLSNYAAIAIHNAQLFEAEARRRREAETLRESATTLTSALELEEVLDNILIQLEQVVPYDSACVFLHQGATLYAVAGRGFQNQEQIIGRDYSADDAIFQTLLQNREPLCLDDASVDPRFQGWGDTAGIHGWLGIPLMVRQSAIGCLTLDSNQIAAYSQADMTLGQTFANQAAIAIANAQLFEQTQLALVETEGLYQVSQALIGLESLSNLLQTVANQVAGVLPATCVVLITLDLDARQTQDIVISETTANISISASFDELMEGLTGWVICHMEPALSLKGNPDSRESLSIQQIRTKNDFGSIIVVPLHYREEIFGTMTALNHVQERDFTERDVKLMVAMANQAAVALKNSHLLQATQEARQLSDSLREIGASLVATLDPDEVLARILDGLGKVVPYNSASVMLKEGNLLRIRAGRNIPADSPIWSISFNIDEKRHDRQIYQEKKPLIIPDTLQNPHWTRIEGDEQIRCWLGVPLLVRGVVFGFLNLDHNQPGFYTEEHAVTASIFAQQASIALENARLFDETYHRAQQLAVLNELASELTGLLENEELCDTVARRLYSVFDYYNVAIFSTDLTARQLVVQSNFGAYAEVAKAGQTRLAFGERIVGRAAETGQPMVVNDTQQHPDFVEIEGIHTHSELVLPLKIDERLIGILCIDSDQRNAFDDSDVAALTTVADQLAVAMEKAHLFAETRRRAEQLEVLRQITQDLTLLHDLDSLLQQIMDRAAQLLKGDGGGIHVYNHRTKLLEVAAIFGERLVPSRPPLKPGEGLIGTIWVTGKSMIVNDYDQWSNRLPNWQGSTPSAGVGVPIQWGKENFGVLGVTTGERDRHFTTEDELLLSQFADQAAIALQNARLFEATNQRLFELEIVRQASLSLTSTMGFRAILDSILENAHKLLPATKNSHIFLYENERIIFGAAIWDDKHQNRPLFEPRPDGLTHTVAKEAQLVVIPDIPAHPLYVNMPLANRGSIIGIPLKINDQVVGVMTISSLQVRDWSDIELRPLQLLADQAAVAIENLRLFEAERAARKQAESLREQTKQHLTQITRLYELSTEVVSTLSMEEAANLVIEKVVQATGAHSAALNLVDGTGALEIAIGPYKPSPRPAGTTMSIVKSGQPLTVSNVEQCPEILHPDLVKKGIRAFVGLPLKTAKQIIGALFVGFDQPRQFSEREVETLFIFANQAAIAIQNGRLYGQVQQHAAEMQARVDERTFKLKALYDLTQALSQATQLEDVIRVTLLQLYQTLPHQVSASLLITNAANLLVIQSHYTLSATVKDQIRVKLLEAVSSLQDIKIDHANLEICQIQPQIGDAQKPALEKLCSSEIVPILIGDRVAGALLVGAEDEIQFDSEQIRLLEIVANQAAETIGRLQSLLAAEHQRLENLVADLPSGIILLDADRRIVLANKSAKQLMPSLTAAQVGDLLPGFGAQTTETILTQASTETPLLLTTEEQPEKIFEVTAQPISAGPEVGGAALVLRDITEEQTLQRHIQQQERMAAVGQLAAGIAHDFNNILTSIIGYAELLLVDQSLSVNSHEDIQRITKQGHRAAHLVRQILDFSRQTITEKQSLDLASFVEETIKLLQRTIPEDINISLDTGSDEYHIKADATQMQQALTNLAVNARDAMPSGGELKFKLARLFLSAESELPLPDIVPGQWVVLKVTDTGSGIPPELQGQIFEPFFTTKEVGKGTGLGLAQVYGIVKQHEGHIHVTSDTRSGTTFTLYIPARPSGQEASTQKSISKLPRGHNELILLVEDDPSVLTISTALLQHLGYRVVTATNGIEALEVYERHQRDIALVLTDMTMPKMGGAELTLALCERNPNIKVIALTGYPLEKGAKEVLTLGIVDWLLKPLSLEDLALTIDQTLKLKL